MRKHPELIIKPTGHLTSSMSGTCTKEIERIDKENPNVVIADFEDVTFVDSSAISCLVRLSKACRKKGIFFAVLRCQKIVRNLLYSINLNKEFPID